MQTILISLTLSIACALSSATALAKETAAPDSRDITCAREKFRGKDASARLRACLKNLQEQKRAANEQRSREEIERLRLELRERCAQDPRGCEVRRAELERSLQDGGREAHANGHAKD